MVDAVHYRRPSCVYASIDRLPQLHHADGIQRPKRKLQGGNSASQQIFSSLSPTNSLTVSKDFGARERNELSKTIWPAMHGPTMAGLTHNQSFKLCARFAALTRFHFTFPVRFTPTLKIPKI